MCSDVPGTQQEVPQTRAPKFYVSQMLATLLGVRLGSWHPHHVEKESRIPHFPARLPVTHAARPFQFESIRFGISLLPSEGGVRAHACTHNSRETVQTQTWVKMFNPRITVFNQNTVD